MIEECLKPVSDLFMIEQIDAENNVIILANYVFNKRSVVNVSDEQIKFYARTFDEVVLKSNLYLFVEFDEKRGVIVG